MKKITLGILGLISLSALLLPVAASAVLTGQVPPVSGATVASIGDLVTKIETFMWVVFGGIAVICFVVAGILFLVAGGDPEKVQKARSAFIWGVAGVVVGIIAYSILAIVGSAMGY